MSGCKEQLCEKNERFLLRRWGFVESGNRRTSVSVKVPFCVRYILWNALWYFLVHVMAIFFADVKASRRLEELEFVAKWNRASNVSSHCPFKWICRTTQGNKGNNSPLVYNSLIYLIIVDLICLARTCLGMYCTLALQRIGVSGQPRCGCSWALRSSFASRTWRCGWRATHWRSVTITKFLDTPSKFRVYVYILSNHKHFQTILRFRRV